MDDEKLEFSQRLREAMRKAGMEEKPATLQKLFNRTHWGVPVSFQAVSGWMRGKAIPRQERLQTLAEMLKVTPEVLRFGPHARRLAESPTLWAESEMVSYGDRQAIEAFLGLPEKQRRLITEIIEVFIGEPIGKRKLKAQPGKTSDDEGGDFLPGQDPQGDTLP